MPEPAPPRVVRAEADRRFRAQAEALGMRPDTTWVGGYVAYEWGKARHVFESPAVGVRGKDVLEFGCNVGASAVVLAALGARVTAIDVDERYVELARANAERHDLADRVAFKYVQDTRDLPYARASFDVVTCNSVLEYVPKDIREDVQREIDRVLRPGGLIVILGTSSRLWPKEIHSKQWVNWLPRAVYGAKVSRGVSPFALRKGFGDYEDVGATDGGSAFVAIKGKMGTGGLKRAAMAGAGKALGAAGISVGMVLPSAQMILRKR